VCAALWKFHDVWMLLHLSYTLGIDINFQLGDQATKMPNKQKI
jgi:hypothetical protein